jgi:hypothetical protein
MSRISRLAAITVVLFLTTSAPVGAWRGVPGFAPSDPDPSTETLLEAVTNGLPNDFAVIDVMRWALRPVSEPLVMPPYGGPVLVMVERGQLTARQHGVETRLETGDVFAPTDDEEEVYLQVRGAEEARILIVAFQALGFATACFWGSNPLVHDKHVLIEQTPAHTLPQGSVRLRLERLTVPPGRSLPAHEASSLVWTSVGKGVLGLTLQGQMPFLWEPGKERTLYPGQPWPQIPDPIVNPLLSGRTQMTLRNAGEDPLVLYRLTLTPSGGEMAALGGPPGGGPLF